MTDPKHTEPRVVVTPFQREERYLVAKRKHLTEEQEQQLRALLESFDLPPLMCAVVESDWPEYETVWQMIEARVTGTALAGLNPAAVASLIVAAEDALTGNTMALDRLKTALTALRGAQ